MGSSQRHPIVLKMLVAPLAWLTLVTAVFADDRPKIEVVPSIPHSFNVNSLVFSPDGARLLSGSRDHTMKLWDATTSRLLRTFEENSAILSVAFSPDGRCALSGNDDGTIKLWNARTGQLLRIFKGHSGPVNSVAISQDGTRLVSGSSDHTLKLWDVASGELIRTFEGHTSGVSSVAFSPDGTRLLSGSWDQTLKLWDPATGRLVRTFVGHTGSILSVAFSPDGTLLVSGSGDNTMKVWAVITGQQLRTFVGHAGEVNSVAFSPDGARLLSGSNDKTMKIWDVATGHLLLTSTGLSNPVLSVAFSPDGARTLSGSSSNIQLWDIVNGRLLSNFGGNSYVTSVAFSPNGDRLSSGSYDATLKLWNAASGQLMRTFVGHSGTVWAVAFSPDGTRLLSGSQDKTVKLWDAATGRLLRTFEGHSGEVWAVAFSPDGTQVLSGSQDKTMKLWDAVTGNLIHTFDGHTGELTCVAFSPDGTRLLSGSYDTTLKLWEAKSGQLLHTLQGHSAQVTSAAYFADGVHVLSGSLDKTLKLWDAATGQLVRTFVGHSAHIWATAVSSDGARVLSGGGDNTLRLWDTKTGESLRTFEGHSAQVTSVAFSRDGMHLLSGSWDTTVRIWNPEISQPLASLFATPDGEWLAITSNGFFAASSKGSQALSIVHGFESYSVFQFYDHLYRQDLVEQLLKGDPEGKYADAASKLNLEKILDSGPAPQIEQLPGHKTELIDDTAKVTVRLTDTGGGIAEKIVWRVNGVTQGEVQGATSPCTTTRSCRIATQTLRLDPAKKNVVEVTAYNGAGLLATEPYRVEIDKFGVTSEERPHMYVVAVGVSDYAKTEWHLKYAAEDAKTVGDTFKAVARGLYGEPKVVPVLDKDATAKGIEAAIDSLRGEVKPSDVFVLYVAGHGRSIAGTYYFLPQDLQFEGGQTVMSGGISQDMLQKWLAKIPAQKSILILDTCESAAARGGDTEQETAIDRLQHATGRSVITAASSSAFEGYQGHGLLTYTILDELTKSEGSGNEEVTLSKLAAYVYDQVPKISQHVFGERQQPHNTIADDFPLGERVTAANTATSAIGQVDIPKTPTHVLIRAERVREQPRGAAPVARSLEAGTQVRVVQLLNGWAVIAREGEKLGYVPEGSLLQLH